MMIDDCLGPFKETILLDYAFSEYETSLGDQSINELSVNGLETLTIQFCVGKLILSSITPFRLNRTREKLVINHVTDIGTMARRNSFLRVKLCAPTRYRDDNPPPTKIYENRYRDEAYMQSLVMTEQASSTPLEAQIMLVTRKHNEGVDDAVLDELIRDGKILATQRELFHMTLCGAVRGFINKEELAIFRTTKQAYEEAHAVLIACSLQEDISYVKKWGSLGEADMLRRMNDDAAFYVNYNEVNATKRTEWILYGSELQNLRFFNLKGGVNYVDFYNRSFHERPIAYGTRTHIKPYEHMRVCLGGAPVLVTPIGISYSAGQ